MPLRKAIEEISKISTYIWGIQEMHVGGLIRFDDARACESTFPWTLFDVLNKIWWLINGIRTALYVFNYFFARKCRALVLYDTLKVAKSAKIESALADGYDPVLSRHFDL